MLLRECAPIPDARSAAAAVGIGDKLYVFGGRDGSQIANSDLWQYDTQTNSWTNLGATPISSRVNAVCISMEDNIYLGLGFSGNVHADTAYLQDWWRYNTTDGSWKRMADYPSRSTNRCVSMQVGDCIYVYYGGHYGFTRDIWCYDTHADRWTYIPDSQYRALSGLGMIGAGTNGYYYLGGGFGNNGRNYDQWWQIDPISDTWIKRRSIPGGGRELAAAAIQGENIWVVGGQYFAGTLSGWRTYTDILRYNSNTDSWDRCAQLPTDKTISPIAVVINDKLYTGLGENQYGEASNQIWCIE